MNSNYPYQNQSVRDLAWACFSAQLLDVEHAAEDDQKVHNCRPDDSGERREWLRQLDANPEALHQHLAGRSQSRVGLYFEALWHFFLQHDPLTELITHNLPVRDNGRTLGEFDCLYFCSQHNRYVHLELAVKYFLGIAQDSDDQAPYWLGPNKRDRLDIKLSHMLERQIRLGERPEARTAMAELGVPADAPLHREIALRGYLFHHWQTPQSTPVGFNGSSNGGNWLELGDLEAFCEATRGNGYIILPRLRWLSAARFTDAETMGEADQLMTLPALLSALQAWFSNHDRPLLIAALGEDQLERQRFFVTPNGWTPR